MDAEGGDGGGDVISEKADKNNRVNGKATAPAIAEELETITKDGRKSGNKSSTIKLNYLEITKMHTLGVKPNCTVTA